MLLSWCVPRLPDGQFHLAAACFPWCTEYCKWFTDSDLHGSVRNWGYMDFFHSQKEEDKSVAKFNGWERDPASSLMWHLNEVSLTRTIERRQTWVKNHWVQLGKKILLISSFFSRRWAVFSSNKNLQKRVCMIHQTTYIINAARHSSNLRLLARSAPACALFFLHWN